MNGAIDPSCFQEVIDQLRAYTNKVFEHTANMTSAASTCASVMDGDPVASKSVSSLQRCTAQIQEGMQQIHSIISGMQRELEEARAAQQKGDFDF